MHQVTYRDRLRYQFDNIMSRGPIALIGWLLLLSILLIVIFAILVVATGIAPVEDGATSPGFLTLLWVSLMHSLDAGTLGGDSGSPAYLAAMMGVTLGGIFLVSTLIGVLSNGIAERFEDLRKGRSFVVESDHTVILGWSSQIFSVISELVLANESKSRGCIVILADREKVEMEDEIRAKVGPVGKTRIVCRSGNPVDMAALDVVNPRAARSIIILGPETSNPDSAVIKTILALTNHPQRRRDAYHIVAEIQDARNMEVARMVGRDEVELVLVGDLIARITVQTAQQSGLSVVYTELLDFNGDEIYFAEEPALVGKTFGEALFAYEDSSLIGLRSRAKGVQLLPPMDQRIETGDKVIVISRDDNTIRLASAAPSLDTAALHTATPRAPKPNRTLILGWNQRGPTIVSELASYVAPGSEVVIVGDDPAIEEGMIVGNNANQVVHFLMGDTTDRRVLEGLDIPGFTNVIVLSASETLEAQEADARTLITLLHLRDMAERGGYSFSIVSEMLDIRNRDLAEVTQADDFIVSDKLVGLMLSQVSEHKELAAVFADLFDPEGAEIYLKHADDYVQPGLPVTFATVVEAARRRGEIAIGYRINAEANNAARQYGVRVNPPKSNKAALSAEDAVIVIAAS